MKNPIANREYHVYGFETFIYREDGHGEEWEIPITCDLSGWKGSAHEDDPSELEVISCKVGETNGPYQRNSHLILTQEEQETVIEKYLVTQ